MLTVIAVELTTRRINNSTSYKKGIENSHRAGGLLCEYVNKITLGFGCCGSTHNEPDEPELAHSKLSCLLSDCHLFMLIVLCLCRHVVIICLTNQSHPGEPEHTQSALFFLLPPGLGLGLVIYTLASSSPG